MKADCRLSNGLAGWTAAFGKRIWITERRLSRRLLP